MGKVRSFAFALKGSTTPQVLALLLQITRGRAGYMSKAFAIHKNDSDSW